MFGVFRSSAAAAIVMAALTLPAVHEQVRTGDSSSGRLHRVIHPVPETVISVQVTTGTLTMTGWDRPDIEIDIVRHAPTAARIEEIGADIEADGPAVRVSAVQRAGQRDPKLTADITIEAPRTAHFEEVRIVSGRVTVSHLAGVVNAKSDSGDLIASDLAGTVRLETLLGRLSLSQARLIPGGLIRLRAFQGDVALALESTPPDARILATTFNGRITSDIPLNAKDQFGVRFAETTLGRGEPVISIDVVTGNIEIRVRKGP
jgi:hypothetical protein